MWALHINSVTVCAYKLCVFGLQDIQQVKTSEELENFMLKHGENIIDTLGIEVDRLEKELKVPEKTTQVLHLRLWFYEEPIVQKVLYSGENILLNISHTMKTMFS